MKISRFNSEGCYEQTPYEAIRNIPENSKAVPPCVKGVHTYRPVVFICSPYADDVEHNTQKACDYCRFAVGKGMIPVAPHLMDESDPEQRKLGLSFGLVLCTKCVWSCGCSATESQKV